MQRSGLHDVSAPCHASPDGQASCVVTEQTPIRLQHAPRGGGQGLSGLQDVPAFCHVLGDGQARSIVIVQVPAGAQHAPVGPHGLG